MKALAWAISIAPMSFHQHDVILRPLAEMVPLIGGHGHDGPFEGRVEHGKASCWRTEHENTALNDTDAVEPHLASETSSQFGQLESKRRPMRGFRCSKSDPRSVRRTGVLDHVDGQVVEQPSLDPFEGLLHFSDRGAIREIQQHTDGCEEETGVCAIFAIHRGLAKPASAALEGQMYRGHEDSLLFWKAAFSTRPYPETRLCRKFESPHSLGDIRLPVTLAR
jgi:hypothetical protein